mmetsp:Transcript_27335/g.63031  ORF Transcript_27335/g.63031 Transcript_27335/m.63031 type:complete len:647 (-) Transcript_27335:12-1952(-)
MRYRLAAGPRPFADEWYRQGLQLPAKHADALFTHTATKLGEDAGSAAADNAGLCFPRGSATLPQTWTALGALESPWSQVNEAERNAPPVQARWRPEEAPCASAMAVPGKQDAPKKSLAMDMNAQVDALRTQWEAMYGSIALGFRVMDSGGKGVASFADFRAVLLRLKMETGGGTVSRARRLFDSLDVDGDGMLCLQDITSAFVSARYGRDGGACHKPPAAEAAQRLTWEGAVLHEHEMQPQPEQRANQMQPQTALASATESHPAAADTQPLLATAPQPASFPVQLHAQPTDGEELRNVVEQAFQRHPGLKILGRRLTSRSGGVAEALAQMDTGETGFLSASEFTRESLRRGICSSAAEAEAYFTVLTGNRSVLLPVVKLPPDSRHLPTASSHVSDLEEASWLSPNSAPAVLAAAMPQSLQPCMGTEYQSVRSTLKEARLALTAAGGIPAEPLPLKDSIPMQAVPSKQATNGFGAPQPCQFQLPRQATGPPRSPSTSTLSSASSDSVDRKRAAKKPLQPKALASRRWQKAASSVVADSSQSVRARLAQRRQQRLQAAVTSGYKHGPEDRKALGEHLHSSSEDSEHPRYKTPGTRRRQSFEHDQHHHHQHRGSGHSSNSEEMDDVDAWHRWLMTHPEDANRPVGSIAN